MIISKKMRVSKYNHQEVVGKRFGRLVIISISDGKPMAVCKCDCGVVKTILWYSIKYGLTRSCGCLYMEFDDLTNKEFGDLIVLKRVKKENTRSIQYLCKCSCGNEVVRSYIGLKAGKATHCGCKIKKVKYLDRQLYEVWKGMKARCRDKNNISYKRYGAKGVRVCELWEKDFTSFYTWAISNGWKKGLQIDKDIKGNGLLYSPETCCVVTRTKNIRAASFIKMSVEYAEEVRKSNLTTKQLASLYNVHPSTIINIRKNKTWVKTV